MNINFFKRSKKNIINNNHNMERVDDVLTLEQRCVVRVWYKLHKKHIDKMVAEAESAYAPSLFEDKNDPMLWKAEYWKWYVECGLNIE